MLPSSETFKPLHFYQKKTLAAKIFFATCCCCGCCFSLSLSRCCCCCCCRGCCCYAPPLKNDHWLALPLVLDPIAKWTLFSLPSIVVRSTSSSSKELWQQNCTYCGSDCIESNLRHWYLFRFLFESVCTYIAPPGKFPVIATRVIERYICTVRYSNGARPPLINRQRRVARLHREREREREGEKEMTGNFWCEMRRFRAFPFLPFSLLGLNFLLPLPSFLPSSTVKSRIVPAISATITLHFFWHLL